MPKCTLLVKDQCNVKFVGLDPGIRQKMHNALKFLIPNARHIPAVRLGRWDGTVSFCTQGGSTFLNVLDQVLPIVTAAGYEIEIDDRRPQFDFTFPAIDPRLFADKCWPLGHAMAGEPIVLRDYQVTAIDTFVQNMQSVLQIATAAGKTLLTAALSWLVQPFGRSVVIVPSKNLVSQTEEDYRNLGLDVGVYFGDRKEIGRTHTIATWQSLAVLDKRGGMAAFLQDVVCVINDEVHSAKAKLLQALLTGPFAKVPIRWGLTGTIPKEQHEAMCLLTAIGPVVGAIRAVELQEKGILATCQVEIMQLQDDSVEFSNYDAEHDFLVSDPHRVRHIATLIDGWAQTGNTLVLVDRIETGELLTQLLPDAVFICGDTKIGVRQQEFKSIQTADRRIIIATYGVASVGINLPRIFNLVLLEPGKSFIRVIQSIGRGLRKAKDKDYIRIIDLCSSLKYSKRHLSKRKPFYNEQEYPHTTTKVNY